MATKKEETKTDAKTPEGNELTAIAVKSLTNLEEKVDAIVWKLWEIYNIVKTYVETNPAGTAPSVSSPQPPQPSTAEIAAEVAKQLQGNSTPEEKKSVVGKLFGK